MLFDYRINNIPCQLDVYYEAGTNHSVHSASEIDNDPEELEITVLDRKGRRAEWLDRYLTGQVEADVLKMVRGQ